MAATTTFQGGGYPGRLYGSFSGKEASAGGSGAHNPGRITQLQGGGYPGMLYGSFAGKAPSAGGVSDSNITLDEMYDGITIDESLRFSGITGMYNG